MKRGGLIKMGIGDYKIVDFEKYCPKCKYYENGIEEEPCWTCVDTPGRIDSRMPEKFKEKETKHKK